MFAPRGERMNAEQEILVKRLEEAGLSTRRFLKVGKGGPAFEKGEDKAAFDTFDFNSGRCLYGPDDFQLWPRWGVCGGGGLVLVDKDNRTMTAKLDSVLPPTFDVLSPRRKLPQSYYLVEGGEVPNKFLFLLGDKEGSGEVRAQNQYLVAPGTEIRFLDLQTGEEKTGRYTILHDRPIARVSYADFMKAVEPYFGSAPSQRITHKQMREGVSAGSRHSQGIKYATLLVGAKGLDAATALHELRAWNQLNRPPLNDHDLVRMAQNASGYVAGKPHDPRQYFTLKENGKIDKFVPRRLGEDIKREHHFATHRESWTIYHYDDGAYRSDGKVEIRELARECLGEQGKDYYITEVEKHIQDTTFKRPEEFEPAPELLCVENGILNTVTRELKPHTPATIFLSKLDAEYNPEAKCPTVLKRLYEWTGGNMKDLIKLIQFAGFCLYRDYFVRKAIIIHGEGNNGKTTFILFMTRWLGVDSVASVKVQKLEKRFTAARLFGKLANLCDDLPGDEWFSTGSFKQATGGSPLEAEKKFKDEFLFCSYAKMLFTGNRMPIVSDDTLAFWNRIALISFGQQFSGGKVRNREDLLNEMLTDGERSGFLNLALEGLASLLNANEFYAMEDTEETKKKYMKISDPVMAFGHERAMSNPEANTVKRAIYAAYVDYCVEKGFPIKENNAFARSFKRVYPHIEDSEVVDDEGRRHNSWRGVDLMPIDEGNPEKIDNSPHVPQDTHVSGLYQMIAEQIGNDKSYIVDRGEYPAKPAKPTEAPPTEHPKKTPPKPSPVEDLGNIDSGRS